MTVYPPCYALVEYQQGLALLSLPVAERYVRQAQMTPGEEGLRPQPLLIPQRLTLGSQERAAVTEHQKRLAHFGIDIVVEQQRATLRAVPLPLRQQNLQNLISDLLGYLADCPQSDSDEMAAWIARRLYSEHESWTQAQAVQLLADIERLCPERVKVPPSEFLYVMDIESAIKALKHD